ncbi:MAG: DUF1150 family protein [Pseudomonadota bacterium]
MNTPYTFDAKDRDRIVYVRPVAVAELPREVREQAMGMDTIYAVHNSDGERLALVKDRDMAFFLAREHDYAAVNVH